jgi:phosphoribosylformimino-5-aminoimidazole carboxamide ribotide isomerase
VEDIDRYASYARSALPSSSKAPRSFAETISIISQYCSELLIHAADVEGLCQGIDEELVSALGEWCEIPVTYAGGAREIGDLDLVDRLSNGRVDLTFGS